MSTVIDLIATEQVSAVTGFILNTVSYSGGNVTIEVAQTDGFDGTIFVESAATGFDGVELIKVVWNITSLSSVGSGAPYDWESTSTTDASVGNIPGFGALPTPLDTTLSSGNTVTATGDLEVLPVGTVEHSEGSFLFALGLDTISTFVGSSITINKLELHLVSTDDERFWTQRVGTLERDL